jgi:hypothetical protein
MTFPTNDDFANRELSIEELERVPQKASRRGILLEAEG